MNSSTQEIAAAAARLVVEDGLEFGPAKRQAVSLLGLSRRTALPGNVVLEAEVRDYIALFCAHTQPGELLALRRHARLWMLRMSDFRPHVGGAVWRGTATRRNDIYIHLFCDDSKSAEIALIDLRVPYHPQRVAGFTGEEVDVLSIYSFCRELNEEVTVHLLVYDFDDLRGALKPDAQGRSWRGNLTALERILASERESGAGHEMGESRA